MFLSAQALVADYNVHDQIAQFFVDREPPVNNLYWKDKQLYLRPQPGYLFIPLIVDLYYRSGIPMEQLLGDRYVDTVETILHHAAEQEMGIIDHATLTDRCRERVTSSVNTRNKNCYEALNDYFHHRPSAIDRYAVPFRSLRRGDVFLYSLFALDITEQKFYELVHTWFALIATLLLLDDSEDYLDDMESGEDNVFIESGSNKEGFERIKNMLAGHLQHIATINRQMETTLHHKVLQVPAKPGIREYINA